jgi:hypothetical protein
MKVEYSSTSPNGAPYESPGRSPGERPNEIIASPKGARYLSLAVSAPLRGSPDPFGRLLPGLRPGLLQRAPSGLEKLCNPMPCHSLNNNWNHAS